MLGTINNNLIQEQSASLKLSREEYESELKKLVAQQRAMAESDLMEQQVEVYCRRMRQNLDSFGFEEKRTALKALQIKALVTATDVQVKGVLGIEADLAMGLVYIL